MSSQGLRKDVQQASRFIGLPYDIRHLIYQHLFPQVGQIYIFATGEKLNVMDPEDGLDMSILLVCRQIYQESAGHLYNRYLFNIVGTKNDCVNLYSRFLDTFQRHARQKARIDAFSNGEHSNTSCLSIQAGNTHLSALSSRRRGRPTTIEQLAKEAAELPSSDTFLRSLRSVHDSIFAKYWHLLLAFVLGLVAIALPLFVIKFRSKELI